MKVHAIQTGWVRIKTAQPEGHGKGVFRQLAIFADRNWTDWVPTYAWLIDHDEGPIVVDTGQGAHLLECIARQQQRGVAVMDQHRYVIGNDDHVTGFSEAPARRKRADGCRFQRERNGIMLAGKVDGVSPDVAISAQTLAAIGKFTATQPTIYLPTHDTDSAARLAARTMVPREKTLAATAQ